MKKKFICIFPKGEDIHITKDVGMIPYMLQRYGYYISTVSFYADKKDISNLDHEFKDLNYIQIKKIFKSDNLNILVFLLLNLFKYDVVMMFHPSIKKVLIVNFIKFLHFGKIKFYFKMDANESVYRYSFDNSNIKNKIYNIFYSYIDLITTEIKELNIFLSKTYFRAKYLPNGFFNSSDDQIEKEKLIITVARVGVEEKDHETLLRALEKVELGNWKIKIIGPIENSFMSIINRFYESNIEKKDSIIFTGSINDRKSLEEEYKKAQIFIMTSKKEGFPLVFPDAIGNGCYVISSDLACAKDITDNGKYGKIFDIGNYEQLAIILQEIINGNVKLPLPNEIINYANSDFNWKVIVGNLYKMLNI